MVNLPVVITAAADAEVNLAAEQLENERPGLAREFLKELDSLLNLLAHYPESCQRFRGPLRRGFLHRFRYTVVYSVRADAVVIIGVKPSRRNPTQITRWADPLPK